MTKICVLKVFVDQNPKYTNFKNCKWKPLSDAPYFPLSKYVNQNTRKRLYRPLIGVLCATWKKNWQGSALDMFSSQIYTKSFGSTDFQKALSGIHCMMFVTPNAEHLRSVRPRRQALSMIVHFTYQRTGSLALRCHLPPCYVHDYWFLIFVCVSVGRGECEKGWFGKKERKKPFIVNFQPFWGSFLRKMAGNSLYFLRNQKMIILLILGSKYMI